MVTSAACLHPPTAIHHEQKLGYTLALHVLCDCGGGGGLWRRIRTRHVVRHHGARLHMAGRPRCRAARLLLLDQLQLQRELALQLLHVLRALLHTPAFPRHTQYTVVLPEH